jgi:hypothetical protein
VEVLHKLHVQRHKQKGIFQLSYVDIEHNDDHWKINKDKADIAKVEDDPRAAIPRGLPAVTTIEPMSESKDEYEITFTGAWSTPIVPIDENDDYDPAVYCCPMVLESINVA